MGHVLGADKGAQDSPNHVDVNRRPQIVKVEKTSSLWGPGGIARRRWGGGYHSVIGGRVFVRGIARHHTAPTVAPRARWPDSEGFAAAAGPFLGHRS